MTGVAPCMQLGADAGHLSSTEKGVRVGQRTSIGAQIRTATADAIYEYMESESVCRSSQEGLRAAHIFRECGFDWGEHEGATSTNQQYWVVAALRHLEASGRVVRDSATKKWRLA